MSNFWYSNENNTPFTLLFQNTILIQCFLFQLISKLITHKQLTPN